MLLLCIPSIYLGFCIDSSTQLNMCMFSIHVDGYRNICTSFLARGYEANDKHEHDL